MSDSKSDGALMSAENASDKSGIVPRAVPCKWCGTTTLDLANAQCWRCLHLSTRIARDLPLARRMIAALSRPLPVEG